MVYQKNGYVYMVQRNAARGWTASRYNPETGTTITGQGRTGVHAIRALWSRLPC